MKTLVAGLAGIVAFSSFAAGLESAFQGRALNVALLTLPAHYLADIPLDDRSCLLLELSSTAYDRRLDYANGWLQYHSDNPEDCPRASSRFWLKLLPQDDEAPLVFVHMAKPFADGSDPARNQTFVLRRQGDEWLDVTEVVIPSGVDLTLHFRPSRTLDRIEVATYEPFERRDGRGKAYRFGAREFDLIWKDGSFHKAAADSPELSKNF